MSTAGSRILSLERKLLKSDVNESDIQQRERELFAKINAGFVRMGRDPLPEPVKFVHGMADDILAAVVQGNRSESGRRGVRYIAELLANSTAD